jgi:hypothetical protein
MYVYTVTNKNTIDSIFEHGFSRQFLGSNEGTDYGNGVYTNLSLTDSQKRFSYTPNGAIIKSRVIGDLNRFLIFDEGLSIKIHGTNQIKDQVFKLFPKDVAQDVWNDFSEYMRNRPDTRSTMNGRTAGLLQTVMSKRLHPTINKREKYENLFSKYDVKGAIYRGIKDGFCLVAYNFTDIVPVSYSTDGVNFKNRKYEGASTDVHKKYYGLFKNVEYPVGVNTNNGKLFFSKVQKKNGKYNYIEIESGDFISPIDFDTVTLIDPNTGEFQFDYNDITFDGNLKGFISPFGELCSFDELDIYASDDFTNLFEKKQIMKKWNNTINEITKNVVEKIKKYGRKLNEDITTEFEYAGYDVPEFDEIDNNNSATFVYHVTPSESIEGLFKYGFDEEYLAKNGIVYGRGIYTTLTVEYSRTLLGNYGDAMVKCYVIGGFDKFLVFGERPCNLIFGKYIPIKEQLLKIVKDEKVADFLYSNCGNNVRAYSDFASEYGLRGAIYDWGRPVAVLPYDLSSLIPYSVSYNGGKTFTKKVKNEFKDRLQTSKDTTYRFGNKYKKISKAIPFKNKTGYAIVTKNNGKVNYLDINTEQELLPFDVDNLTYMDPNTGEFQFDYKGHTLNATIDGFIGEDGEKQNFSELDDYIEYLDFFESM